MKRPRFVFAWLLALAGLARADQSVTLAWDPNPEPDVRGYIIHFGTNSHAYPLSTNVGNVTTATVYGLQEGVTWYFAIAAVNATGLESDFSIEITNRISSREILAGLKRGSAPNATEAHQPAKARPDPPPPPPNPGSAPPQLSPVKPARPAPGPPSRLLSRVSEKFGRVKTLMQSRRARDRLEGLARRGVRLIPLALGLAGCLLAAARAFSLLRYRRAQGTIETRSDSPDGTARSLVVYTRAGGVTCLLEPPPDELPPAYAYGDAVTVLYHPTRLNVGRVNSRRAQWRLWRWPLLAGTLGVLFVAVTVWRSCGGSVASGTKTVTPVAAPDRQLPADDGQACRSRLEFLGLAVQLWAFDHGGKLPTNVLCLKAQLGEPSALVCPADRANRLARTRDWGAFDLRQSSYELSFPGTDGADSVTVIARCKQHGHILHATLRTTKVMEVRK